MTTKAMYKYTTKGSTFTFMRSLSDKDKKTMDKKGLIVCRLVDILYAASRERHINYLDIRRGINMMKNNFNAEEVMENIIESHK
jgi:hypothetical protein